jgi:hypothetical protein
MVPERFKSGGSLGGLHVVRGFAFIAVLGLIWMILWINNES